MAKASALPLHHHPFLITMISELQNIKYTDGWWVAQRVSRRSTNTQATRTLYCSEPEATATFLKQHMFGEIAGDVFYLANALCSNLQVMFCIFVLLTKFSTTASRLFRCLMWPSRQSKRMNSSELEPNRGVLLILGLIVEVEVALIL